MRVNGACLRITAEISHRFNFLFFEVLEKEMKDSKGEKDVPDSLRGEAVFACFPAYNQRMLGTDWDEDDLSDYGKLIAEAKKLAAKTQTNIITEPAGGPPAWQTATTNNITQTKKAAVVKQEAAFVGGAGFPPRGRNRGRGRGRGSSGAGRGGGHGGQERGQEMNPNDCPKCGRAGGHDPEWLEKNDCPGKTHTCEICGKYGHRPRVCTKKGDTANTPLASTSNSRGRGGPHSQRGRGGMQAARGSGPRRFDGKAAYYAQHEKNDQGCTPDQYEVSRLARHRSQSGKGSQKAGHLLECFRNNMCISVLPYLSPFSLSLWHWQGAEGGIRQTSHTTFRMRDGAPQPFFVDVKEHHACMVDSTGDDAGPPDKSVSVSQHRPAARRRMHIDSCTTAPIRWERELGGMVVWSRPSDMSFGLAHKKAEKKIRISRLACIAQKCKVRGVGWQVLFVMVYLTHDPVPYLMRQDDAEGETILRKEGKESYVVVRDARGFLAEILVDNPRGDGRTTNLPFTDVIVPRTDEVTAAMRDEGSV
uniref:CCHC-type domain-containing protein n=1 Tax=Chromera velia CCMP2878 TaxID=1169474 RepID=A0A0G4IB62_9ALVE|eukprot:Cvel_2182.t1-p1 / transcript=Cvel_2182.t1 / gene=Cvel_2182 / organism=Chromera_velia_CCMP2878 / gene_product=hypothetical protein / transcript_product=hypothetical protein / location=Cvel_scaffold84:121638-123230(+) / protein_length=531 / sequence_SO=supercontig / SO=protein_coding / is_pseudo=false